MKKFISMLLAGLLLTGLFILAGCDGSDNSAEIDALKKQIAALQQQIQDMESGSGGGSSEAQIAELRYDISILKGTISTLETTIETISGTNNIEVGKLKEQLTSLQTRLTNSEARILLLEGSAGEDPNKVYHLGDTVSYSSNGMKLFEIKVYRTGNYSSRLLVSMTYTNYNMAAKLVLDQIYTSILIDPDGTVSTEGNLFTDDKYIVPLGQTIDLSIDAGNASLTFERNSWGKKKLYFGIYNKVDNKGSFIPFACYELEFTETVQI